MIESGNGFNEFIVPMTISPFDRSDIAARPGPRYRAIADALRDAVKMGSLAPGTKLPPLRDLAYELGVTVGTVSRAYALAATRGEVAGEVGRGTYVLGGGTHARNGTGVGSAAFLTLPDATEAAMKAALAPPAGQTEIAGAAMTALLAEEPERDRPSPFNTYLAPGGEARHRQSAADWLAHDSFAPKAEELLLCSGTQQAILTAILSATEPGDLILTEELTYHAMVQQAALMGRRVAPVDIDAEGLVPEALERAAREQNPAALFVVPTLQNPTSAIMSEGRRQRIAEIARAGGFAIIEDDIYGKLVADRPLPLAHFAPDITFLATSLAKSVGCGLRVGFLKPPPALFERARAIQHGQGQTVPPLMADLATRLIETGDAATIRNRIAAEMATRHDMTARTLRGQRMTAHPASLYVWIELPESWRAHALVEAARARGIAIAAGEDFMVGRTDRASRHVRLAIGQPQTRDELQRGLDTIAALLSESHIGIAAPA
jgi:DNA-binding transcriptional MocR family regulator